MPTFKEAVAADIERVFINPVEFAEPHRIRLMGPPAFDEMIECVVDEDIIDERKSRGGASTEYAEGVYKDEVMLYVSKGNLPYVPVRFEQLILDDVRHIVQKVSDNMGVLEITMESNES